MAFFFRHCPKLADVAAVGGVLMPAVRFQETRRAKSRWGSFAAFAVMAETIHLREPDCDGVRRQYLLSVRCLSPVWCRQPACWCWHGGQPLRRKNQRQF